jgi:hypothetical protein
MLGRTVGDAVCRRVVTGYAPPPLLSVSVIIDNFLEPKSYQLIASEVIEPEALIEID